MGCMGFMGKGYVLSIFPQIPRIPVIPVKDEKNSRKHKILLYEGPIFKFVFPAFSPYLCPLEIEKNMISNLVP